MLSPAQLDARAGKLTASRVACLMAGDAEKILRLYREMIGEEASEDLSDVWPVRRGECMEPLILEWFERKNGPLSRYGEVVVHPRFSWAAATLDAWFDQLSCPVEAKDVGGREPMEVITERYQPQCQWLMEVTGASQCALTVSFGGSEPITEFIPADPEYQFEMVQRGAIFMHCVHTRTVPVALEPVPAPVDASKTYDFQGSNSWAAHAATWLESREAADKCKDAEKSLKALVPADAVKAFGHGVRISRDRAGRLSLREDTQ